MGRSGVWLMLVVLLITISTSSVVGAEQQSLGPRTIGDTKSNTSAQLQPRVSRTNTQTAGADASVGDFDNDGITDIRLSNEQLTVRINGDVINGSRRFISVLKGPDGQRVVEELSTNPTTPTSSTDHESPQFQSVVEAGIVVDNGDVASYRITREYTYEQSDARVQITWQITLLRGARAAIVETQIHNVGTNPVQLDQDDGDIHDGVRLVNGFNISGRDGTSSVYRFKLGSGTTRSFANYGRWQTFDATRRGTIFDDASAATIGYVGGTTSPRMWITENYGIISYYVKETRLAPGEEASWQIALAAHDGGSSAPAAGKNIVESIRSRAGAIPLSAEITSSILPLDSQSPLTPSETPTNTATRQQYDTQARNGSKNDDEKTAGAQSIPGIGVFERFTDNGTLPLVLLGGIVVGGIGLSLYRRNRQRDTGEAETTAQSHDENNGSTTDISSEQNRGSENGLTPENGVDETQDENIIAPSESDVATGSVGSYDDLSIGETIDVTQFAQLQRATVDSRSLWALTPVQTGKETVRTGQYEAFTERTQPWIEIDDHPGLLTIHGNGTEPIPWIALNHGEYPSLLNVAAEETAHERVRLLRKICKALVHVERHGVIYGTLTPNSVIVRNDGQPVLLGVVDSIWDETVSWYTAPEQVRGERTEQTVVYRLGVVTAEVLTKTIPFPGYPEADPAAVISQSATLDYRDTPSVSRDLAEVLEIALANDPTDRYESVSEFYRQLDSTL